MRRGAVVAAVAVMGAVLLAPVGCSSRRKMEIRGTLSAEDLSGVIRAHRSSGLAAWPTLSPKWLPFWFRQRVFACLNPIDIIAVPKEGVAIVVYRGYSVLYYDKEGKHRWGTAYHTMLKETNGWQAVVASPQRANASGN